MISDLPGLRAAGPGAMEACTISASWSQESCRDDGHAVGTAIGEGTRVDHHQVEDLAFQGLLEPEEVTHILVRDRMN